MKVSSWVGVLAGGWLFAAVAVAHSRAPVSIEIIDAAGQAFREFPVQTRDGALRSYLQAQEGARYRVRVRNTTGERLGLVIAVDGRNIINGARSELSRSEPMYVLAPHDTQDYAGWRASLDAINEFYFTDWNDSYAEAFGDRSARGVIAIAVYGEAESRRRAETSAAAPSARSDAGSEKSAGTGYGDLRIDQVVRVKFVARANADSRHFIKYEWRDTLCRKNIIECGEQNRFWDETTLGFAPPPRRHR